MGFGQKLNLKTSLKSYGRILKANLIWSRKRSKSSDAKTFSSV